MKLSLRARMILLIWGATMLLFAALLYVGYRAARSDEIRDLQENAENLTGFYALKFESFFTSAAQIPRMSAIFLESGKGFPAPEELKKYLLKAVMLNPLIYGSCLAFEPEVMGRGKKHFAPYGFRRLSAPAYVPSPPATPRAHKAYGFRRLDAPAYVVLGSPAYDYFGMDWYRKPKAARKGMWMEPYFDRGGGNIVMTTYSVPIVQKGRFLGVSTVDISLMELTDAFSRVRILESGYGFIVSGSGVFLSCPDKKLVLSGNIRSFNPELAGKMAEGAAFFMETKDPLRGEKAWIVSSPIRETGFSLAVVYPEKEVLAGVNALQRSAQLLGILGLLLLLVLIIYLSNSITKPITELVESVQRVARGELDKKLSVRTRTKEVLTLQKAFNKMVEDLKKHLEELRRAAAEKQKIESELSSARQIQLSGIPRKFPPFPDRPELDVFARTLPAREVGGDFYDFFFIDQNRFGFVIGDASGKGMPAAIFMSVSRAFIKAIALQGGEPGQCLAQVNDLLCREESEEMFITVFFGILDTGSGEVLYCNGGHNPPYKVEKGGFLTAMEEVSGPALGVCPGAKYNTLRTTVGEGLFLYSDGVTEAWSAKGEMFGMGHLTKALRDARGFCPERAVHRVLKEVEQFTEGGAQSDDITVLAIRWVKDSGAHSSRAFSLELKNRLEEVKRLPALLSEFEKTHPLGDETRLQLNLSLEEILVNVISYAWEEEGEHFIRLSLAQSEDGSEIVATVEDDGRSFNPLEVPAPDTKAPFDERPVGGLGLHLVRNFMDSISYRRENDKNFLEMRKKI